MDINENDNNDNTDIENITKISQKKIMLGKSNKVKSSKQILQWENAQKMRLRKAELKRQKDDENASIRNENNKLKKQIAESVVSKNVKKKKAIIPESESESDSESDASAVSDSDSESDSSDVSEDDEVEIIPKPRKRQVQIAKKYANKNVKILKPKSDKSHRMANQVKDVPKNTIDFNQYFV